MSISTGLPRQPSMTLFTLQRSQSWNNIQPTCTRMTSVMASHCNPRSDIRIPKTLQAVFLASNRGKEVNKPPPQRVAHKVFFRSWPFGLKKNRTTPDKDHPSNTIQTNKTTAVKQETAGKVVPQKQNDASNDPLTNVSPKMYLEAILRERGYSTKSFKSLECAYCNKPSELQKASYHIYLVDMIRQDNMKGFREVMNSGISLNPCNAFGESLIHTVCRRGHKEALEIMLEAGSSLQTCDDFGRTPLHDACWAAEPNFAVVEMILARDMDLLRITDCRGALPLSYVRKEHWKTWRDFIDSKKDMYFPTRDAIKVDPQVDPSLTKLKPGSHSLPMPENCLTPQLASLVASGRMKPAEAALLSYNNVSMEDDLADEGEFDDDSSSSDLESVISESEFLLDENEMEDILKSLSLPVMKPVAWSSSLYP